MWQTDQVPVQSTCDRRVWKILLFDSLWNPALVFLAAGRKRLKSPLCFRLFILETLVSVLLQVQEHITFQLCIFSAVIMPTSLYNSDHNNETRSGGCCCREAQWLPNLHKTEFPMPYLFWLLCQGAIYQCVTDKRGNSGDLFSLTYRQDYKCFLLCLASSAS